MSETITINVAGKSYTFGAGMQPIYAKIGPYTDDSMLGQSHDQRCAGQQRLEGNATDYGFGNGRPILTSLAYFDEQGAHWLCCGRRLGYQQQRMRCPGGLRDNVFSLDWMRQDLAFPEWFHPLNGHEALAAAAQPMPPLHPRKPR